MHDAMIIDDSEKFRTYFKQELSYRKAFNKIYLARSGSEAIKKQKKLNPRVIFLDMQMPKLEGPETLKKIRSFDKEVKVYVVSAFPREDYQDRIKGLNVNGWLAKPDIAEPQELDNLVKKLGEESINHNRKDSRNLKNDNLSHVAMAYETAKILEEHPRILKLFEDVFTKEVPSLNDILRDFDKPNFKKIKEEYELSSSRMKLIEKDLLKD